MVHKYITDIENRIDAVVETELMESWVSFTEGRSSSEGFRPARNRQSRTRVKWPEITVNQAIEERDSMAIQQLRGCSDTLETGRGNPLAVRCNYGTGILPSAFGAELFFLPDEAGTLPGCRPLNSGLDAVNRLLDAGIPSWRSGLMGKVLDMGAYYLQLFDRYERVRDHVYIYHPDLQGPTDVCEVLLGSDLFLLLVDYPREIEQLLNLITETYALFMRSWYNLVGDRGQPTAGTSVHWGFVHKGRLMIRLDSLMNLSADMCRRFSLPYDRRLLEEFGGGAVHFCGRGDHYLHLYGDTDAVHAVNMTQPEYNNLTRVLDETVGKGKRLLGLGGDVNSVFETLGEDRLAVIESVHFTK